MQRQGGKVQNPGGKPYDFMGAMDVRKPTVHLDLRAHHDLPQRHTTGYAHANPYPFHQETRRTFRLPERTRTRYK